MANHDDAAISAITWMELMAAWDAKLLAGAMSEALFRVSKNLLDTFPVVQIDEFVMAEAAKLRGASLYAGKKLALPDAIILATAKITGRTLVTRNTFHPDADACVDGFAGRCKTALLPRHT